MSKKSTRRFGGNTYSEAKPLESLALGCHPSQVRQFREDAKAQGFTGIDFKPTGECLITSRKQRAEYAKRRGLHDQDGGYGDG